MNLPVVLRTEAQADFDEAFDWYESQRPGLGIDFTAQVQEVFDRISANPLLHAVVFQDLRKAVVRRFPYSVIYRAEATQVLVLAVFHSKREPSIWQGRA
jgi:plasmid stabilization system protein ParE